MRHSCQQILTDVAPVRTCDDVINAMFWCTEKYMLKTCSTVDKTPDYQVADALHSVLKDLIVQQLHRIPILTLEDQREMNTAVLMVQLVSRSIVFNVLRSTQGKFAFQGILLAPANPLIIPSRCARLKSKAGIKWEFLRRRCSCIASKYKDR
jgi:hypothetical protein